MAKIYSTGIAILALAMAMVAPHSTAHANSLIELKHAFLGCAVKADAEQLERLLRAASKANGGAEAVVAYGNAHCLEMRRGIVEVERWEEAYVCVHHPPETCLWVPRALVGFSLFDDGVF
jgi:putative heme degradation protein